jgi:hypothetical protein
VEEGRRCWKTERFPSGPRWRLQEKVGNGKDASMTVGREPQVFFVLALDRVGGILLVLLLIARVWMTNAKR